MLTVLILLITQALFYSVSSPANIENSSNFHHEVVVGVKYGNTDKVLNAGNDNNKYCIQLPTTLLVIAVIREKMNVI